MKIFVTGICGRLGLALAVEAGQQGIKLCLLNFWPVSRIDKAKCLLGWEPIDTFESWLEQHGWKRHSNAKS